MTRVLSKHTLLHREIKKLLLQYGLKVRSLNAYFDEDSPYFGNPDFIVCTDSKDTFLSLKDTLKQREDLVAFTSTGARPAQGWNELYLEGLTVARFVAYGDQFVEVRALLDTRTQLA